MTNEVPERIADYRPSDEQVAGLSSAANLAQVVVFPRRDGLYPGVASDFVALLRETGVKVAYATDPTAAKAWEHKSGIEQVLPAILIAVGDVGTVVSTIDAIASVVSAVLERHGPKSQVFLDAGRRKDADGGTVEWVSLKATGDPKANRQMVKDVLRGLFED
jgi:hypothetical protein